VLSFVVGGFCLAIGASSLQTFIDFFLRDGLNVFPLRQSPCVETLTEKGCKTLLVAEEPRFHANYHKVAMRISNPRWYLKALFFQVLPGRRCRDLFFTVDKEESGLFRITGCLESIVGSLSSSTGHNARHTSLEACPFEKTLKSLSAASAQGIRIPASLYVELDYHRLPPISPLVQRLPRLYCSNHGRRWAGSRRRRDVRESLFSQTRITSGVLVKASTKSVEWVVTTS